MLDFALNNMPLVLTAVGLALMALEAISPGAHLIVIGVALVAAGVIGLVFPPAAAPLVLAALVLVFGAAAAYVYREFDFYGGKGTAQTSDSDSLAGATGYATERITSRSGQVKLDGGGFNPYFQARTTSGTIEEGEEVIVIDPGGGNVLTVEEFGAIEADEIDRELAREAARSDENRSDEPADDAVSTEAETGANATTAETETEEDATATETEKS